jgi:hypothetical protein
MGKECYFKKYNKTINCSGKIIKTSDNSFSIILNQKTLNSFSIIYLCEYHYFLINYAIDFEEENNKFLKEIYETFQY